MIDKTEAVTRGLIASGFVLSSGGDEIFRYQKNFFMEVDTKSKSFVYPVPKLVVVGAGEAEWLIGSNTFHVSEGDIIILRPGILRHFSKIPPDMVMECDVYEFVPSFIGEFECLELFKLESSKNNTILKFDERKSPRILECFSEIKKEVALTSPCCGDVVKSLLTYIIVSLVRAMGLQIGSNRALPWSRQEDHLPTLPFEYPTKEFDFANVPVSAGHSVAVAEVIDKINRSLSTEISIDELASCAHISRSHFYKIFRKYTGMSINDFILKCRVENTIRLLLNTGCSVIEAAYDSGFTSSSGFYKAFKKITGLSPKEYMKSIRLGKAEVHD